MSAKRLYIDLETCASRNPAVIEAVREEQLAKQPAMNKSKEEKMLWNTEEGRRARIAEALHKTAVDVLRAEILVVAFAFDGQPPQCVPMMESEIAAGERMGLRSLSLIIDDQCGPETVWVGHNIESFDLSVLLNRYRAHGVEPPKCFPQWRGRYWHGRVHDTMKRTPCPNGLGMVSLADCCMAYGLPSSKAAVQLPDGTPLTGATVQRAYELGCYDLICAYALADIDVTRLLYSVQTWGHQRDCYEAEDDQWADLYAIRDGEFPASRRAELILRAMASKGLCPRDLVPGEITEKAA